MSLVFALGLAAILGIPADTVAADACALIPMDQLRFVLTAGIGRTFPLHESHEGAGVSLTEPKLAETNCPALKVGLTIAVHVGDSGPAAWDGTVRLVIAMVATASFATSHGKSAHTAPGLVEASLCVRRVEVRSVSLKNGPSWLTEEWLNARLGPDLVGKACFDVTSLVYVHLQRGGTLDR